uniref:Uncharacterized protein n=1 Tax=Cacopsylla melanoneura TaxID=428564 RepID=A0A8D8XYY5_9HEMI
MGRKIKYVLITFLRRKGKGLYQSRLFLSFSVEIEFNKLKDLNFKFPLFLFSIITKILKNVHLNVIDLFLYLIPTKYGIVSLPIRQIEGRHSTFSVYLPILTIHNIQLNPVLNLIMMILHTQQKVIPTTQLKLLTNPRHLMTNGFGKPVQRQSNQIPMPLNSVQWFL